MVDRRPVWLGRFEYATYPTEAHGFLRAGPRLDFLRRVERFLDRHLM